MIFPHLMFAHMVADYPLQTNWLAVRKGQALDGLLLHGFSVFVMSVLVLARYFEQMIVPMLLLFVVHTSQDAFKIWIGRQYKIHLAYGYFADQLGHLVTALIFQQAFGHRLNPQPGDTEVFVMTLGTCLIAVTRFYDVSWWANWFDMIVYMERWQVWAAAERIAMLLAAMAGPAFAVIAPIFALPRLFWAWRSNSPLWLQKYGIFEWAVGIVFSIGLGILALNPLL